MGRILSYLAAFGVYQGVLVGIVIAQDADDAAKTSRPDPRGTWKWERTFNDNTAEFVLKLNWDGKLLSGEYTAFDNTSTIEETKLERDTISFIARREFNGNEFEVAFDGQVKPDDIVGKVTVDFGNGPQEFDWHAKRAVEIDDVLGVWDLQLETPNGLIEPRLTITKDKDDKLHGAYVSPFGEREAKNVTLKDNELSWEISGKRDGARFKVFYTGKPRGSTIEGTNEFDFGGNTGTIEFTGKRTPPAEKEKMPPEEARPAEGETAAAKSQAEPPGAVEPAESTEK
jgi:hypothetical protein